jgi:hypothetical protein
MPLHKDYRPVVDALLDADPDTSTEALVQAVRDAFPDDERVRSDRLPQEVESERKRYLRAQ